MNGLVISFFFFLTVNGWGILVEDALGKISWGSFFNSLVPSISSSLLIVAMVGKAGR